ncbi:uncharacterized protein [Argopecten irradians]|uniref:uncharacterized protein n=1 Tax=Argopecten irradians TaxID=31199 RepID=UPI003718DEB4
MSDCPAFNASAARYQVTKGIPHGEAVGILNSLDVAFDAGGKVNIGLTSTTIISQWTWAATLLQSSTVASKYGISGPFWYAAGATIQILLFAMISVQLKIKAPGAKTFLQVIKARFDSRTHKTFCVFALMTNVIVTAMLMLGGAAVLTSLIQDISVEYATVLIAAVIGAYTLIGGLGATVYVSYFNTSIIYIIMVIFIMKIYNDPDSEDNPLGSIDKVYTLLNCTEGPIENSASSYLTILSKPGLMFGMINIVGNFGTVFVDQSYWQCSVAAKPKEGVIGFLVGGVCWFAIPFALATTTGLAYIALGTTQNGPLLTEDQVNAGLVPPAVAQRLLGRSGEFLIIIMIIMAVTSTGSAEVIAVTSILVYDVYQLYLKPYRLVLDANSCLLCGKARGRMANPRDKCTCESMLFCLACKEDNKQRESWKRAIKPPYSCAVHGKYREYTDYLSTLKNWCLLWSTIAILPLTIFLDLAGVSLAWVYMFMGILIGSAVVPIALSVSWDRLTGTGMTVGSISGTILAVIVWLTVASTYEGGLSRFLENTACFSDVDNVMLAIVWAMAATIFIIIYPVLTEAWDIYHAFKEKRLINPDMWTKSPPQGGGGRPQHVGKLAKGEGHKVAPKKSYPNKADDTNAHEGFTDPNMIDHITEADDTNCKAYSQTRINDSTHI